MRVSVEVEDDEASVSIEGHRLFRIRRKLPELTCRPNWHPGGFSAISVEEAGRIVSAVRLAMGSLPREQPAMLPATPVEVKPVVDLSGVARGLESLSISVERLVTAGGRQKRKVRR